MKDIKKGYTRVKNFEKYEPFVHKVPCKYCGFYNNPSRLHKRSNAKYYKCCKCGRDLKSEKEDFKDRLSQLLKEGK